jgi:hypothetical protein
VNRYRKSKDSKVGGLKMAARDPYEHLGTITDIPDVTQQAIAWAKGAGEVTQKQKGDPRFHALLQELGELHNKKSADYGLGTDFLANVRASEEFGVPAWKGAVLRMNDKITRIKSSCMKGKLENESMEGSLKDIAAYSLIALLLWREKD